VAFSTKEIDMDKDTKKKGAGAGVGAVSGAAVGGVAAGSAEDERVAAVGAGEEPLKGRVDVLAAAGEEVAGGGFGLHVGRVAV